MSDPESPFSGEKTSDVDKADRDDGWTFSSADKWPGSGKGGEDKNRAQNHQGNHGQEPITGTLELKGYPTLRAKASVRILGAGPAASGDYYVKKVKHSWKPQQGYKTTATLARGGAGQGGVGGSSPMVMYADIWKKGSMYFGPRKTDGEPQAIFTFGDGKHWIEFEYDLHPQPHRGGGEPGKGKGAGIDLRKLLKPYFESSSGGNSDTDGDGPTAIA